MDGKIMQIKASRGLTNRRALDPIRYRGKRRKGINTCTKARPTKYSMRKSTAFNSSLFTGGCAELSAVLQSRRLSSTLGDCTSHAEFIEPNESMFETPTTTKEVD